MKLKRIAASLITAIVMMVTVIQMPLSSYAVDLDAYAEQVILLVNLEREAAGLAPLYAVPKLNELGAIRSSELVQSFSHTRPDGSSVSSMLSSNGVSWMACGENVAYGYSTPTEVVNGWMSSTGHRANILTADYNQIGVGVVYKNGTYYWTQLFVKGTLPSDAYLPTVLTGDVNGDKRIDSSDASAILTAAARLGSQKTSGLDALQEKAADVDGNGTINAADAAYILMYAAISGVGNTSLEEVVKTR